MTHGDTKKGWKINRVVNKTVIYLGEL